MSELIDNRARRVEMMKTMVRRLHDGESPETVRIALQQLVGQTDASEVAAMEQQLIAEGMTVEQIKPMCDLHAAAVRGVVRDESTVSVPAGHPVDTFRRENAALREVCARMRAIVAEFGGAAECAALDNLLLRWRQASNELMDIDKHYHRKEHLLFACLERHGILGPSKVMWAKDDDVRASLKALNEALASCPPAAAAMGSVAEQFAGPALVGVEGMIEKEELILLPMALQTLTEAEWGEVWSGSAEIGWCLVEPCEGYEPPGARTLEGAAGRIGVGAMVLPTGALNLDELLGIFQTLPVDLTFVDADDRVRFFSEGPDRVFVRGRAVLGRKVQHCHPPSSVDSVDRILDDFRAGRQNAAEFWIKMAGRFIHIRYFAVRSEAGAYLGTLEVTQDCTRIRALEGEQRLAQFAESSHTSN